MLSRFLFWCGCRGWMLHITSLSNIVFCISLWIRAKTVDQDERGNAERRALFVGLWPVMWWLIGDAVERREHASERLRRRARWARRRLPG